MTRALIVVDVQNDFCEGGSLAVEGGADVAARISADLVASPDFDVVVATRDWHVDPGSHFSEEPDYVDTWPVHCAAGTNGARFHANLDASHFEAVFSKGAREAAYSGFEGRSDEPNGARLLDYLRDHDVDAVTIVGIATDYCVAATATDAVEAGLATTVDVRYTAGVHAESSAAAIERLRGLGVEIVEEAPRS